MMRRLVFAVTLVPIVILPILITFICLIAYGVRWIATGQPAPADPMPKWVMPWFNLPEKILGRPLL